MGESGGSTISGIRLGVGTAPRGRNPSFFVSTQLPYTLATQTPRRYPLASKMRASTIQTVLAFGSLASAVRVLQPAAGLSRRQAFDPSENTRPGSDCSVFGDTAVECVPAGGPEVTMLCIDPALGDVCCDAKCMCLSMS